MGIERITETPIPLPGVWTAYIVEKRRGIRKHIRHDHPPLHSAIRNGRDFYGCEWWIERTIREIVKRGDRVIRFGFELVSEIDPWG